VTEAPLDTVLRHIYRLVGAPTEEEVGDGQLLERFVMRREEDAFALLLQRHGGMVLHVARRVLPNAHDAEDIFQATFLLLAKKAASIRKQDSVACWLHGVAYRLASKAKLQNERRLAREKQAVAMRKSTAGFEAAWLELQGVLDEELHRLPLKYQAPLVLCYLEGQTHEEAARQLGWPLGTVCGRVARARDRLRARLARRGLGLSAAVFGTVLAASGAGAGVPARLLGPTLQSALNYASGATPAGLVSGRAAALAEGGLKAMTPNPLKILTVLLLTVTLVAAGAGTLTHLGGAARPAPEPRASAPRLKSKPGQPARPRPVKKIPPVDHHADALAAPALARLGTARLWLGGQQISTLAFTSDSKTLATAGRDGQIILWEMASGKQIRKLGVAQPAGGNAMRPRFVAINFLTFSPNGKALATIENGTAVRVFDVVGKKELWTAEALANVPFPVCAFSPSGKTLAIPAAKNQIQFWDAATGKKLHTCKGHEGPVNTLAFSADGKTLVSGSDDMTLRVWESATGKYLRSCEGHRDAVQAVAVSADGKTLASTGQDKTIRLWETGTGKEVRRWGIEAVPVVQLVGAPVLQFAADGKNLFHIDSSSLGVYATASGKEVRRVRSPVTYGIPPVLAPNGKVLAVAVQGQRIALWDTVSGKEVGLPNGHKDSVLTLAFSPDGKTLATGSQDQTIRLWRAADGKPLRTIPGHTGGVSHLYFTADGKYLASGSNDRNDRVISLWETATGKEVRRFAGNRFGLATMALSPDGKLLAAGGRDGMLHLWQVATGKDIRQVRCFGQAMAFSPDSKSLVILGPGGIPVLWNPYTGKEIRTFLIPGQPFQVSFALAFSPDGKSLLTAPHDLSVHLWEVGTGKHIREVRGRPDTQELMRLGGFSNTPPALSPDGRSLAFPHLDGTVGLLELATGKERRTFTCGQGTINCLAFSPDGKTLATGSVDATALVLDLMGPAPGEKLPRGPVTDKELNALWADLASKDAGTGYRAIRTLAAVPKQTVPFLKKLLPVARVPSKKEIEQLVADLGDRRFAKRRKAYQELEKLGKLARPAIERTLKGKPSLDLSKRLEELLARLDKPGLSNLEARMVRAVETLERIGTTAARELCESLAKGPPGTLLTDEARSSVGRLAGRTR
jgi:RNA polymerase sigma factor (sigma-70 family)